MNQLPENSLRIYDVTLVTSYLIGLGLEPLLYLMPSTRHTQACVFIKITVQN